jgi:hypothetical protein
MISTPNVVFCVFDTMRKDAVGAYGGPAVTPNLDNLAKDGVLYNNCITPAPWTFPTHVSFLTGKYPSEHGLHETYEIKGKELWYRKDDSDPDSIVNFLRKRGYNTIGLSANPWLHPGTIFSKDFNFFSCDSKQDRISAAEKEAITRASKYGKNTQQIALHLLSQGKIRELLRLYSIYRKIQGRSREMNYPLVKGGDKIIRIVNESSFEEPFFFFINFMEMHDPYTSYELNLAKKKPGQPGLSMSDLLGLTKIPPEAMEKIRKQYYRESSCVDSFFGQLLGQLKNRNLYDNTLIIATSDHGQALKEHGYFGHSIFLYDEIVEVPFIVKYPQNKVPSTKKDGYQSLVRVPRLIRAVVENAYDSDAITEPVVFSESFGIPHQAVRNVPEDLRKRFDLPRKAVYKNGYKLTVNWTNMQVEEFTYNGKSLDPSDNKSLCDSLLNEFSALEEHGESIASQMPVMSAQEEIEVTERLRDLGYV